MKNNSYARRLEHRANLRKVKAGELTGAEAAAVEAAEKARREVKPAAVLTRKQRKGKKALKRAK
jgi:hypothetical protein